MLSVGFEPTISAGEWPQTYALDLAATETGNRNYYQEYFLRDKGGRCVGLTTLPPSCAETVLKSRNLMESSGPVQG